MPKMAESPAQVLAFLRNWRSRPPPFAQRRDFAELSDFARDKSASPAWNPWDVAYASEKLLQARYAFSERR